MEKIYIYTDGAARGNPGESGSGFLVIKSDKVIKESVSYNGIKTNNYAEYKAMINALSWCAKNLGTPKDIDVTVTSDSELVVKQLNGQYAVKSADMRILNAKVKALASTFHEVIFRNVRRSNRYIARVDGNINAFLDRIKKKGKFFSEWLYSTFARIADEVTTEYSMVDPKAKEHWHEGNRLFEEEKFNEAIEEYTQAIKIYGEYANAYFNRALAYTILKKWYNAERDLRFVLKIEPKSVDAPLLLGEIAEENNDLQSARFWYEKSLFNDPNYAEAKSKLERIDSLLHVIDPLLHKNEKRKRK
ncbi:MAG: RNase H family protein [Candidatus Micrarchaeaceae archaeon]